MAAVKEGHTRLWVANLQEDLSREQIIHLFEKYGAVHSIVRKGNFASVEFENGSEALRAKRGLDQVDYHGRRLNIDWYRGDKFGKLEGKNWWGGQCGHPRYKHRVIVLGLPQGIGYQNVLDLAWEAGFSVVFIDIATSRCGFIYGIIEYAHYDDYKFALDYLDGRMYKIKKPNTIKTENGDDENKDDKTEQVQLRFIKGDELLSVERYYAENSLKDEQKTNMNYMGGIGTTTGGPPPPNHRPPPPGYNPQQRPPPNAPYPPPQYPPNSYRPPPPNAPIPNGPPPSYYNQPPPNPPHGYTQPPVPPYYNQPPVPNYNQPPPNPSYPPNYRPPPQ